MKRINTAESVGHVLCHDITQIIKDVKKGRVFKKGHRIREEDLPVLFSLGKDHVYVWENQEGMVHEDDAAEFLLRLTQNQYMKATSVSEGKIELIAEQEGLFLVDRQKLAEINSIRDVMMASIVGNSRVKKGDRLAGMRVIPLMVAQDTLDQVEETIGESPIFRILPFRPLKAGIVTTGNEVYHNRIQDTFTPVIVQKLEEYGISVMGHQISPDDTQRISSCIRELKAQGADLILCTGGMSVDPDDLTPAAIQDSGAKIVTYGAPTLPGAMFLLGYFHDDTPILGLPGCVMYKKITVFDLLLPRIAAGIKVDKEYIAQLGYGGFCMDCPVCHYPNCQYGKGV